MSVAIIDYGSGNLRSAAKAFERAARERNLPQTISVTADAKDLTAATHIVLPGVGAFADCLRGVVSLPGMREALEEQVIRKGKPFLGICVGMQLMAERGLEHGTHAGFGWLKGEVRRIEPAPNEPNGASLKIPHMGWNDLIVSQPHPVLDGIVTGTHAYFVHSYHLAGGADAHRFATVDYGGVVTAAVGRDNLFGTQFHPEKSQAAGLRLIANFIRWRP